MALKFTDMAPDFILPNQDGENVNLRQFRGKWVVLYSYPRDNTPGCSLEAQEFTQYKKEFSKLNAVILGVSKDDSKSHCSFIKKKDLDITLLSDEDYKMQKAYGIWRPKKFMGKEYLGTVRMTFLIDPNGRVAKIWDKVRVSGHVKVVLETLKELNS